MSAADRTAPSTLALWARKLRTEAARQTVLLYGAQILSSLLNLAFTSLLARTLGRTGYGIFSFCWVSIIGFLGLLFEFGIFAAGARLLAVAADKDEERRVLGALLAASLAVGALFSVTIACSGPIVDRLYGTDVTRVLLAAAPFVVAVPLQQMLELACQGTNRIGALALLRLTLPTVGLLIVGLLLATDSNGPTGALMAYLSALLAATALVVRTLRPSFENLRAELGRLLRATREFGLDIYFGRAVVMMSVRGDAILIPYFAGTTAVGVYNLARQLSDPVATLARSLAMTRFKAFANRNTVSAYILKWNAALMVSAALGLAIAGPVAVYLFFGKRYADAAPLIPPLALAALFAGLFQPFNIFLSAHGRGRELRDISIVAAAANVVGLLAFVPAFGMPGAAWWAACSMTFSFLLHLFYYRKVRGELRKSTESSE